jgi:hypothetical protein
MGRKKRGKEGYGERRKKGRERRKKRGRMEDDIARGTRLDGSLNEL